MSTASADDFTSTMETESTEPLRSEIPPEKPSQHEATESMSPLSDNQRRAEENKNRGNEFYKKKEFENALKCYNDAIELDPDNISYLTNKAAVFFEMGNYEQCLKESEQAVEKGHNLRVDFKLIAKALCRMGNAYMKMEKYDEAIDALNKALTEDRTKQTLDLLKKAEKLKDDRDRLNYINPQLSLEVKERGNQFFKEGKYPEAIKEYSDAINRNPTDHVLFSNRAACYTKLREYQLGIKDCDECLRLKPDFVKGYIRKGILYYSIKDYQKALEVYDHGLKLDEHNKELEDGIQTVLKAMNERNQKQNQTGELDKETLESAMRNPEIQQILSDPIMQQILQDMQQNPGAVQNHLQNPLIKDKIRKLAAAGLVRLS